MFRASSHTHTQTQPRQTGNVINQKKKEREKKKRRRNPLGAVQPVWSSITNGMHQQIWKNTFAKKKKESRTHRDIIALQADGWIFNSRGATCNCMKQKHTLTSCCSALHSANLLGFAECLLTAQTLRLWRKDEAFLYNPAIMPTMTSADNNQTHNRKYVTHSHRTPQDHYNGLCCLFSSHSLCCLMLKKNPVKMLQSTWLCIA